MTGSRAPLRLGGVPDTSSDRGFWVTQAGALPGPPCQERMPIRVKGGVFLLPVLVVVFEGVLKLFLLFFRFRVFALSTYAFLFVYRHRNIRGFCLGR